MTPIEELIADLQTVVNGKVSRSDTTSIAQRAIAWLETLEISNECLMREVKELRHEAD